MNSCCHAVSININFFTQSDGSNVSSIYEILSIRKLINESEKVNCFFAVFLRFSSLQLQVLNYKKNCVINCNFSDKRLMQNA